VVRTLPSVYEALGIQSLAPQKQNKNTAVSVYIVISNNKYLNIFSWETIKDFLMKSFLLSLF
jgi:hypothetical protein